MLGAFRSILGRQSPASTIQKLSGQAWRRTFTNSTPSKTIQWRGRKAGFAPASRILQQTRLGNQAKLWRNTQQNLLSRTTRRNFNWSRPRTRKSQASGPGTQVPEQNLSLSARLKKLSREYGWAAVGVYFGLSVLDFPFCFALVRFIGVDRIADAEHWVLSNVQRIIPENIKEFWRNYRAALKAAEKESMGDNDLSDDVEMVGWGVEEAQQKNKEEASLATQLALAYAIHKSFIFIRVPLTAAVTPKVVKVLRSWGWQIGKRKPKK